MSLERHSYSKGYSACWYNHGSISADDNIKKNGLVIILSVLDK